MKLRVTSLTILKVFYKLLVDSFQGEHGLSWVPNEQFALINGLNERPTTKKLGVLLFIPGPK